MTQRRVLDLQEKQREILDLRFIDVPGICSTSAIAIGNWRNNLSRGFGFDASSFGDGPFDHYRTCCLMPDRDCRSSIRSAIPDAGDDRGRDGPASRSPITPTPRGMWPRERRPIWLPHRACCQAFFGADAKFFLFSTAIRFDQAPQHGFFTTRFRTKARNSGREETILVTGRGIRKVISPFPAPLTLQTFGRKMVFEMECRSDDV